MSASASVESIVVIVGPAVPAKSSATTTSDTQSAAEKVLWKDS